MFHPMWLDFKRTKFLIFESPDKLGDHNGLALHARDGF